VSNGIHPRRAVRDAVIQMLKDAVTEAGTNVFGNRLKKLFPQEIPAILVYTKDEQTEAAAEPSRALTRQLALIIEPVAVQVKNQSIDDFMDGFCLQIEKTIDADPSIKGLVVRAYLKNTEMVVIEDAEKSYVSAQMTYELTYQSGI
jgi:hypothetical protein